MQQHIKPLYYIYCAQCILFCCLICSSGGIKQWKFGSMANGTSLGTWLWGKHYKGSAAVLPLGHDAHVVQRLMHYFVLPSSSTFVVSSPFCMSCKWWLSQLPWALPFALESLMKPSTTTTHLWTSSGHLWRQWWFWRGWSRLQMSCINSLCKYCRTTAASVHLGMPNACLLYLFSVLNLRMVSC